MTTSEMPTPTATPTSSGPATEKLQAQAIAIEKELAKVIVGYPDVLRGVLITLLAGGHALIEGAPGLGKTLLVRTLAGVLDLTYSRIPVHARPDAVGHPGHQHSARGRHRRTSPRVS